MIKVDGLRGLTDRLTRLDLVATEHAALEQAATGLQDAVRQRLSHTPGQPHEAPWLRSGTLRGSITHEIDGTEAVVASADPIAADQECGTRTDPPRPFLAPVAAAEANGLVTGIAVAVLGRLRVALT